MASTAEKSHGLDNIWGESWTERWLARAVVDLVEGLQTRLYNLGSQAKTYQRHGLRFERHPEGKGARKHLASVFGFLLSLFE